MKHSYWIPTNRRIEKSLRSYVNEIEYCSKKYNIDIPIFILDSENKQIETDNKHAIQEIQKEYNELKFYHITYEIQKKVIGNIIEKANLDEKWIKYFLTNCTNYGAVMNRIFILAAGLGFDVIHRRDSDTFLQDNCPFPLDYEIGHIGKPYKSGDNNVYLIGSGYVGEWNLNIKEFVENNQELFHTFLECLNIPREAHEEFMDETYNCCKKYFKEDEFLYVKSEEKKLPEAGNFCIYDLHKKFPCSPANYTIGADYFTFKMAIALEYPFIFHERRVCHEYHLERKSEEKNNQYFKSLMKFCDQSPVYWYYINHVVNNYAKTYTENTINENNIQKLLDILSEVFKDIVNCDKDRRNQNIIDFNKKFLASKYPKEAEILLDKKEEILEECLQDYNIHAQIIKNWNKLTSAAENLTEFICSMIKN